MPQTKPILCPLYSVTHLYVEYTYAEDPNTPTPFVCYIRNTVGMGKRLQSDLRFRIRRWGQRKVLTLQTFLSVILSSLLSHSSCIIPSSRSCSRPPALSQLNSWPKVSFFALSSAMSSRLPALLRCRPNSVSALSTAICLRAEEKLESQMVTPWKGILHRIRFQWISSQSNWIGLCFQQLKLKLSP